MAHLSATADPALGLLELDSVAVGVATGDAMVKASPVAAIHTGTVHPGRFLIAVSGDTASVEIALDVGRSTAGPVLTGAVFLPAVDRAVTEAIVGAGDHTATSGGEAVGIVECAGVPATVDAADAGVKAASVQIATVRLADGLGGKGYVVFGGVVAEVEAAVEAAVSRVEGGAVLHSVVVAQLAPEMRADLATDLRFNRVVGRVG